MAHPAFTRGNPEVVLAETDAALIARIRSGDAAAIRGFYDRYAARVYQTAWRVLRDRTDAEVVTQDVFIRALDSLHQVRDTMMLGPWLNAIAVRAAYDALRSERRRQHRFLSLDEASEAASVPTPDPLLATHLQRAISRLSTKLNVVLVMFELEGFSHAEIAQALKIPVATSKTRLSQARAQLRQDLAAYATKEIDDV